MKTRHPPIHRLAATAAAAAYSTLWLATATAAAPAGPDWPQFRGAGAQGHADVETLPLEWGPDQNVAWKRPLPGGGWSSPVLYRGRLYLTTAVEGGGRTSLRTLCLEAEDGASVWETEVFRPERAPSIHSKNSHASPTPVAEGERLYVHFGHLGTACLDLAGEVIWLNDELSYRPVHGGGGSPALVGDALVFSCDGARDPFVAALDKRSGKVLWRTPRVTGAKKKFSFSTPLLIDASGRPELVSPGSDAVCAYDPASGKELWRATYSGYSVVPRPVFGHGHLFIATGFDRSTVFAVRPGGSGDVTATHVAWTVTKGAPHTPSLLLVGGELYMVSDGGVATCLDARTGDVHWKERVAKSCSASPIYGAGRIYIQDEEGLGVVLRAGKRYELLARNDLRERTLASYAAAEGTLFIRTEEHLYRIGEGRK